MAIHESDEVALKYELRSRSRSQRSDAVGVVSQIDTGFIAVPRHHAFRENVLISRHGNSGRNQSELEVN